MLLECGAQEVATGSDAGALRESRKRCRRSQSGARAGLGDSRLVAAAIALAAPSLQRGHAQEVVLLVDGQPITALDIEQRTKFIDMSTHKAPTRQEVIDSLIDEILEIREAKRFGIDASRRPTSTTPSPMSRQHGCRRARS